VMESLFRVKKNGETSCLSYIPWETEGIRHGFLGKVPAGCRTELLGMWEIDELVFLDQFHSSVVLETSEAAALQELRNAARRGRPYPEELRSDGVIVKRSPAGIVSRVGYALETADCLPILLRKGAWLGLVHAGWRGLAGGIVVEGIRLLARQDGSSPLQAVIGPCAGAKRYEVGREVIDAIGAQAVFEALPGEKYLLSLEATACRMIQDVCGGRADVSPSGICTISDERFHSFRREAKAAGRNLSFLIP
jgi:copper oxidase (laccase) domain-containing protein